MSKDKREFKLDIISGIDEKIIDRNTEKRIKLLARGKKAVGIGAKKIIAIVAAALVVLLLGTGGIFFMFKGDSKAIPVYEGMTASVTSPLQELEAARLNRLFLFGQSEIFGVRTLDASDGIPDVNATEAVSDSEAETDSNLDPSGSKEIFYANMGEDFYITVHINNPDNFEIVSFTLNGKKYSSYMFEQGSDMENLVLKCNAGEQSGIIEYTIDAIKYIDGTEIKDVRMDGERTIKIGLYDKANDVSASLSEESYSYDSISFICSLADKKDLLKLNEDCGVYARLYKDDEKLAEKALELGKENSVSFDGLEHSTDYKYTIEAEYDSLDGQGFATHLIYTKKVKTNSILVFTEGAKAKEALNIAFKWDELAVDNAITSIELYQGENKIKDVPVDTTVIDGLIADNEYTLIVKYSNKGIEYTLSEKLKTESYIKPSVIFDFVDSDHHNIHVKKYIETDPDNVGSVKGIELWYKGELVSTSVNTETPIFGDLYSDNLYTVKINYEYDMRDGKGIQNKQIVQEVRTTAYQNPTIWLENVGYNIDQVAFAVTEEDPYNLGKIEKISLYLGDTLIEETADANTYAFSDLEVNKTYRVEVEYTYDLFNGRGSKKITRKKDIATQSPGLEVFDGQVRGIGECTDTELYINMPIAANAFKDNLTIQKLHFGGQVSYVGKSAFDGCRLITEITMEEGITDIGIMAFRKCDNLLSIDIPNTVTTISSYAFYICDKLESVTLPINCTYEEGVFFGCDAINRVNIRDLKAWCNNDGPSFVNSYADFYVNGELITDLVIPDGVTRIRPYAFYQCRSITSVKMAASVKTIGTAAFEWCNNLKFVIIGEGVTKIEDSAFQYPRFSFIFIPDNVVEVGRLIVPKSCRVCVEASEKPLLWEDDWVYDIQMDEIVGEIVWGVKDLVTDSQGIIYGTDANNRKILLYCPKDVTSVAIGNDVQVIGAGAFYECKNLKSIEIPNSVTEIRELSFFNCSSLRSVFIPNSVERVELYGFYGYNSVYIGAASKPNTWEWTPLGNVVWNVKSITVDADGNVTNIVYNS